MTLHRYRCLRASPVLTALPGDTILHDDQTGEVTVVRFRRDITPGTLRVMELNGILVADPMERRHEMAPLRPRPIERRRPFSGAE